MIRYDYVALGVCLWLGGCAAEAQVLARDAHGGELLLSGPRSSAASEARLLMAEHCAGHYALVGSQTAQPAAANTLSGRGHVQYVCASAGADASQLASRPTLLGHRTTSLLAGTPR